MLYSPRCRLSVMFGSLIDSLRGLKRHLIGPHFPHRFVKAPSKMFLFLQVDVETGPTAAFVSLQPPAPPACPYILEILSQSLSPALCPTEVGRGVGDRVWPQRRCPPLFSRRASSEPVTDGRSGGDTDPVTVLLGVQTTRQQYPWYGFYFKLSLGSAGPDTAPWQREGEPGAPRSARGISPGSRRPSHPERSNVQPRTGYRSNVPIRGYGRLSTGLKRDNIFIYLTIYLFH